MITHRSNFVLHSILALAVLCLPFRFIGRARERGSRESGPVGSRLSCRSINFTAKSTGCVINSNLGGGWKVWRYLFSCRQLRVKESISQPCLARPTGKANKDTMRTTPSEPKPWHTKKSMDQLLWSQRRKSTKLGVFSALFVYDLHCKTYTNKAEKTQSWGRFSSLVMWLPWHWIHQRYTVECTQ